MWLIYKGRMTLISISVIVSGDGEGGIEMTDSMRLIREFCDLFITPEKNTRARIVRYKCIHVFPTEIYMFADSHLIINSLFNSSSQRQMKFNLQEIRSLAELPTSWTI